MKGKNWLELKLKQELRGIIRLRRFSEDFQDFIQKAMHDMQLDMGEWAEQNLEKMLSDMLSVSDLSRLARSFGGFDISGLASMLGGMRQGMAQFDPYMVLKLDRNCSDEEVKERYRDLMKVLHPDKTGGKTEFFSMLVNAAYEQICRERGMK